VEEKNKVDISTFLLSFRNHMIISTKIEDTGAYRLQIEQAGGYNYIFYVRIDKSKNRIARIRYLNEAMGGTRSSFSVNGMVFFTECSSKLYKYNKIAKDKKRRRFLIVFVNDYIDSDKNLCVDKTIIQDYSFNEIKKGSEDDFESVFYLPTTRNKLYVKQKYDWSRLYL
jgi:hypothetical protein